MKKLLFALLAVAVSPPLFAQVSGTITSSQLVCIGVSADHSTVGVQVTGTWTGTLQPQVAIQGQALTNSQVVPSTSTTPASTITANGVYYANVGSASQFCILGNTVGSGSAVVFLNAAKGVNASTLGGGGGSGTVTNSGNLVNNNLLLGAGATSIKDYGSSVLAPANGGVANVSTAGQGYFAGPGMEFPGFGGGASQALVLVGQQVVVFQFVLPFAMTVRNITYAAASTVASSTITVGIYSADGNTKLIDSGTFNGGSSTAQTLTITPVTLPPGTYFFAQSASTQTTLTSSVFGALSSLGGAFANKLNVRYGTAANAAVAGVLPATLGVITSNLTLSPATAIFEP